MYLEFLRPPDKNRDDAVTFAVLEEFVEKLNRSFRSLGGAPASLQHASFFNKVNGKVVLKGPTKTFVESGGNKVPLTDADLPNGQGEAVTPAASFAPTTVTVSVTIADDAAGTNSKTKAFNLSALAGHFFANLFIHVVPGPAIQVSSMQVVSSSSIAKFVDHPAVAIT